MYSILSIDNAEILAVIVIVCHGISIFSCFKLPQVCHACQCARAFAVNCTTCPWDEPLFFDQMVAGVLPCYSSVYACLGMWPNLIAHDSKFWKEVASHIRIWCRENFWLLQDASTTCKVNSSIHAMSVSSRVYFRRREGKGTVLSKCSFWQL